MPKYLFEAHYTAAGAKGVAKEGGTGRRTAIAKMAEALGGKLESFYFAFGGVDAYVVVDAPDNVTAAAVALAVNQSGAASVKTVVLITPEEMDKAGKKTVDYRPPGH
ncbi:MAG: GYD domain-containing protein [Roseiarcus sp.]